MVWRQISSKLSVNHNTNMHDAYIILPEPSIMLKQLQDCLESYYIHTYKFGHYNPTVRIINLVFYTAYVVCVNFIHKWRDLQFKVDSERPIFWETFHGDFLFYFQSFCQKSAERKMNFIWKDVCFLLKSVSSVSET